MRTLASLKRKLKLFTIKNIVRKSFSPNQKVWLFNFKLRSRWDGPFIVLNVFPHGAVEIRNPKTGQVFKVNGRRLKPYVDGINDGEVVEECSLLEPH